MNFLAHAFLADADPALIVGGVIGDWIKGPLPGTLPADLLVVLNDNEMSISEGRISPARRRYGGVVVDILYDHLLACRWHELDARPLAAFCADVYRLIGARLDDIPPAAHFALRLMADEDWLASYRHLDGIADVLARMSRRARQPNPLRHAEQEYLDDPAGYDADFGHWLDDARGFVSQWSRRP